jgi:hypothetical protein
MISCIMFLYHDMQIKDLDLANCANRRFLWFMSKQDVNYNLIPGAFDETMAFTPTSAAAEPNATAEHKE